MRDEYLIERRNAHFHTLLNYGMIVARDAVGRTGVNWSEDGDILYIRGHELKMPVWKSFPYRLVERMERMLAGDLMFRIHVNLPDFNLWERHDNQG